MHDDYSWIGTEQGIFAPHPLESEEWRRDRDRYRSLLEWIVSTTATMDDVQQLVREVLDYYGEA